MISWLRSKLDAQKKANKTLNGQGTIDQDILDAVHEKSDMSAVEKAKLAECIQEQLNKNADAVDRESFITMCVTGIAGVGVLASFSAEASLCGSVTRRFERLLARRVKRPFEQEIYKQLESALGLFDAIADFGSSLSTTTTIDATDSINFTIQEVASNKIKAATAPAPNPCEVNLNADAIMKSTAETEVQTVHYAIAVQSNSMPSDPQERMRRMHVISSDPERIRKSLNVSSILSPLGYSGAAEHASHLFGYHEDKQGSLDFISHAVGISNNYVTAMQMTDRRAAGRSAEVVAFELQAKAASELARRHVASSNLSKIKASREANGEFSTLGAEVRRRYGSDSNGWRRDIRNYADSNPLCIELCHQLALQAKLQVTMLEQQYTNTIQRGVTLMQYMDSEN